MKLQDERNCLSLITNQLIKIHEEGGFWTEVMGRRVCVKLWIYGNIFLTKLPLLFLYY
jgi:hypothetical protein